MKPSAFTPLLPATAIAVGVSTIFSQPAQASDYAYEPYSSYDDWSYSDTRVHIPELQRAYRQDAPAYHYAYYSIARPEYLL